MRAPATLLLLAALFLAACAPRPAVRPPATPAAAPASPPPAVRPGPAPAARPPARRLPSRRIGILLPSSGRWGTYGLEARRGAELCMEDPRGARAFRLEAIVREETDAGAAAAVSALADDGALAVVGPLLSGAAEKALPAAASRSLAVVSPTASSARLEGASPVFFRTCMTMEDFSSALAGFAAARLGTPRVAMLVPAEPYGRSFADAFRRAVAGGGGRVVASVEYAPALTDVAARAAELDALLRPGGAPSPRETGADALFFAGGPKDAALLLGQLSRRGLEVRSLAVVGGSAFDTPELPRLAGLLAEGALFADGFFPGSERPEARDFVERYRARFGAEPGAAAAQACAAVELLAEALRGGAATREEVLSRLSGLGRVRTVLGPVRSSPGGRVERRPFFGTVSGGRLVELPERGQGTE